MANDLEEMELTGLVGKTIQRTEGAGVILRVQTVSIGPSGTVYVHPGSADTFGWTFKADGKLCGDWTVVEFEPITERVLY